MGKKSKRVKEGHGDPQAQATHPPPLQRTAETGAVGRGTLQPKQYSETAGKEVVYYHDIMVFTLPTRKRHRDAHFMVETIARLEKHGLSTDVADINTWESHREGSPSPHRVRLKRRRLTGLVEKSDTEVRFYLFALIDSRVTQDRRFDLKNQLEAHFQTLKLESASELEAYTKMVTNIYKYRVRHDLLWARPNEIESLHINPRGSGRLPTTMETTTGRESEATDSSSGWAAHQVDTPEVDLRVREPLVSPLVTTSSRTGTLMQRPPPARVLQEKATREDAAIEDRDRERQQIPMTAYDPLKATPSQHLTVFMGAKSSSTSASSTRSIQHSLVSGAGRSAEAILQLQQQQLDKVRKDNELAMQQQQQQLNQRTMDQQHAMQTTQANLQQLVQNLAPSVPPPVLPPVLPLPVPPPVLRRVARLPVSSDESDPETPPVTTAEVTAELLKVQRSTRLGQRKLKATVNEILETMNNLTARVEEERVSRNELKFIILEDLRGGIETTRKTPFDSEVEINNWFYQIPEDYDRKKRALRTLMKSVVPSHNDIHYMGPCLKICCSVMYLASHYYPKAANVNQYEQDWWLHPELVYALETVGTGFVFAEVSQAGELFDLNKAKTKGQGMLNTMHQS